MHQYNVLKDKVFTSEPLQDYILSIADREINPVSEVSKFIHRMVPREKRLGAVRAKFLISDKAAIAYKDIQINNLERFAHRYFHRYCVFLFRSNRPMYEDDFKRLGFIIGVSMLFSIDLKLESILVEFLSGLWPSYEPSSYDADLSMENWDAAVYFNERQIRDEFNICVLNAQRILGPTLRLPDLRPPQLIV